MSRVGWYIKRFRVMTARDLLYRASQQIDLLLMQREFKKQLYGAPVGKAADFRFCTQRQACLPELTVDLAALEKSAPRLLKGQVSVGVDSWQWSDDPDVWHRAPDTDRVWQRSFFGKIDYREGNPTGDIRRLWEPARLQQLVDLALLARSAEGEKAEQAIDLVKLQLTSWIEHNPPLEGPHYISAMECALRLIAVCHALDILRHWLEDEGACWHTLLMIVTSHTSMIKRRLSLYSSTGNHTVAEAAGLAYAGVLFPEMAASQDWLETGVSLLDQAANEQIAPDGGGLEQAMSYHLFNVQLLALVEALLIHHGKDCPENIRSALVRGKKFLDTVRQNRKSVPPIGDSDGGCALSHYLEIGNPNLSGEPETVIFRDSGYTVACIGSAPTASMIFDHGPLGMPPSFGHGHGDALSVLLRIGAEDVLVDPGTFTYTGDQRWRRYFRGTAAHNTVTVDGSDQAQQEGCFLWSKPFRARLIDAETLDDHRGRLVAEHDGYSSRGVRHVRGIAWVSGGWLLVWDQLTGSGSHTLVVHWHTAIRPQRSDADTVKLSASGGDLTIRLVGGTVSDHCGAKDPILGWRSPQYGIVDSINTLKMSYTGPLPHTFTTLIALPGGETSESATERALHWFEDRLR